MIARLLAIGMLGCGAPHREPVSTPPPPAPGDAKLSAPTSPECPLAMRERPPGVSWVGSLAEAQDHLPTIAQDPSAPKLDLAALAKQDNAFFIARPEGYLHESVSAVSYHDAVFVQPKRVTLVTRIFNTVSSMPPQCSNHAGAEALEIAIVNPHLGHLRVRQPVDMAPTAPPAPVQAVANPGCACRTTYIVEDHFIDLDRGEHLRAYGQVYEDDCYHPGTPTVLPFSAFVPTANGVDIATPSCVFFWDE